MRRRGPIAGRPASTQANASGSRRRHPASARGVGLTIGPSTRRLSAMATCDALSSWGAPWRSAIVRATRRTRWSPRADRRPELSARSSSAVGTVSQWRDLVESVHRQLCVAADAAARGQVARLEDACRHGPGGLTRVVTEQVLDRGPAHLDAEVEAVEQRPRQSALVAEASAIGAATPAGPATEPARAGVHRRHQEEAGRKRHGGGRPSHPHDALLQRLPQGVEHVRCELGQLVEEQDAVARGADLAGAHERRAPADQRDRRRPMVRRPERRMAHEPTARQSEAGRRVDARGLERLVVARAAGGDREGGPRASSCRLPGGPSMSRWCPPAAATSSAKRATG